MKKIFPVILLAGALLGGCSLLDKIPAESIRIEGQEYRTGSYENLYPANLSFTGKEYEVEGILYHQVVTVPRSHCTILKFSDST